MLTLVTRLKRSRAARLPAMAPSPISTGRLAATRLPKASTKRTRVIGRASDSARARSLATSVDTSWSAPTRPPAWTVATDEAAWPWGGLATWAMTALPVLVTWASSPVT
jgi:hypothetical protein